MSKSMSFYIKLYTFLLSFLFIYSIDNIYFTNQIQSPSNQIFHSSFTDKYNNVLLLGSTFESKNTSNSNSFFTFLSPTGKTRYSTQINVPNASNSLLVNGLFDNDNHLLLVGTVKTENDLNRKGVILKYNVSLAENTSSLIWTYNLRSNSSDSNDEIKDITSNSNGDYIVIGNTNGTMPNCESLGKIDSFAVKVLNNGSVDWVEQFGTSENDNVTAVKSDSKDSYIIIGNTEGSMKGKKYTGNTDCFAVKLNNSGGIEWDLEFGTSKNDYANSVAVDNEDNYFVAGTTYGSLYGYFNKGKSDAFVIKISPFGLITWALQFGTKGEDELLSVEIDKVNNIIAAGFTTESFPGYKSSGSKDGIVVKINQRGNILWTFQNSIKGGSIFKSLSIDLENFYVLGGDTLGSFSSISSYINIYGISNLFSIKIYSECDKSCGTCKGHPKQCLKCNKKYFKKTEEAFPTECFINPPEDYKFDSAFNSFSKCSSVCDKVVKFPVTADGNNTKYNCDCSCPTDLVEENFECKPSCAEVSNFLFNGICQKCNQYTYNQQCLHECPVNTYVNLLPNGSKFCSNDCSLGNIVFKNECKSYSSLTLPEKREFCHSISNLIQNEVCVEECDQEKFILDVDCLDICPEDYLPIKNVCTKKLKCVYGFNIIDGDKLKCECDDYYKGELCEIEKEDLEKVRFTIEKLSKISSKRKYCSLEIESFMNITYIINSNQTLLEKDNSLIDGVYNISNDQIDGMRRNVTFEDYVFSMMDFLYTKDYSILKMKELETKLYQTLKGVNRKVVYKGKSIKVMTIQSMKCLSNSQPSGFLSIISNLTSTSTIINTFNHSELLNIKEALDDELLLIHYKSFPLYEKNNMTYISISINNSKKYIIPLISAEKYEIYIRFKETEALFDYIYIKETFRKDIFSNFKAASLLFKTKIDDERISQERKFSKYISCSQGCEYKGLDVGDRYGKGSSYVICLCDNSGVEDLISYSFLGRKDEK